MADPRTIILFRYFRRFGLRWAITFVRVGCIAFGLAGLGVMLSAGVPESAAWMGIAMAAIHFVSRALQQNKPFIVNHHSVEHMTAAGTRITVASSDIDRAIERIIERAAGHMEKADG